MRGWLLAVACVACSSDRLPGIDGTYDVVLTAVSGSACTPQPLDRQLETIMISGSNRVNVEKSSPPRPVGAFTNANIDGSDVSFVLDLVFPDENGSGRETYMLHVELALSGTAVGNYTFHDVPCTRTFEVTETTAAARTSETRDTAWPTACAPGACPPADRSTAR